MEDFQRKMFHTQEKRRINLDNPIECIRADAWLGDGFYFWDDEQDAINWGHNSKRRTEYFQIYVGNIDCENVLDTVFNEEHYRFWLKQVEKAAKHFLRKTGIKPSIKDINDYFQERAIWNEVDGIMFQDLPKNEDFLLVRALYYKKRIQLVVYNLGIVSNFDLLKEDKCL
jgi:hypothetical protein